MRKATYYHITHSILFFSIAIFGCGEKKNPYADKMRQEIAQVENISDSDSSNGMVDGSSSDERNEEKENAGGTDDEKQGGSTPTRANKEISELFSEICGEINEIEFKADIDEEIKVFCQNGTATAKFEHLMQIAYDGNGEPKQDKPIKLASKGRETELFIAGSNKYTKSLKDIEKNREKAIAMTVNEDGVTLSNKILNDEKLSSGSHTKKYTIERTIESKIALLTLKDIIILDSYVVKLKNANFGFQYSAIKAGDDNNKDNRINNQISFLIQVNEKLTYGFSVFHMTVDNKGFAPIAEGKIKKQPIAVTKKYYSIIMGN